MMCPMYPSDYLSKLWKRISYPVKVTFASSMAIGLITHLFMITNMLPNHDTNVIYSDLRWTINSGRWFAFIPTLLSDGYFLPWINGLIAIIYIAVSACVVVKLLRINNSLHCALVAGLMVSFPTITSTLLYMLNTNQIFSALLFVCLGVYITHKFRYGFIVGFIFITLSLGCYQAYFSFAAGLSTAVLIIDILQTNLSFKDIVIKGLKLFLTLLLGMIVYFIITKMALTIRKVELTTYQGINEMGHIEISKLLSLARQAYAATCDFFIRDSFGFHKVFIKKTFSVVVIISTVFFSLIVFQKKLIERKPHLFLLLIFLVVLYPLACNTVYLMGAKHVYINMLYGMALLPIAAIALVELIQNDVISPSPNFLLIIKRVACWVIVIHLAACIYNYIVLANKVYTKAYIVYEQGYAYSTELVTRIESAAEYTGDIQVLLFGKPGETINQILIFDELRGIGGSTHNIPKTHSYVLFMQTFLGFGSGMKLANSSDIAKYGLEQALREMPLYPKQGSIKRINNVMVVKFSEVDMP